MASTISSKRQRHILALLLGTLAVLTLMSVATFERPHQYAEGVAYVIVNGQVAFEDGMTAARPGRVVYGPAFAR